MKKLLLSLLIFIPVILSAANKEWKPGYIVTTQNDTIRGYLAYRASMDDQQTCLFKKNPQSPEIFYTPQDLRSYRYDDGLYFQSRQVNTPHLKGNFFIECLLKGVISLYSAQIEYSKEMESLKSFSPVVTAFLAEIPGGEYWVEMICPGNLYNSSLESERNSQKLTSLFQNKAEEMKKDIPNASYNRDDMIALFKKYHDLVCTDWECIIYKEKQKKAIQFLTYYASFGFQKRRATERLDAAQEAFLSPMAQIGVAYSRGFNKFTDRLRLNVLLGLFYLNAQKNTYYDEVTVDSEYTYTENNKVVTGPETFHDIEYHYLFRTLGIYNQVSIEGRFMTKKIQPLLEIGFYQQVYIPVQNRLNVSIRELGDNINSMEYPHYIMGVTASAGISINRKNYQIPIKINANLPLTESIDRPMELRTQFNLSVGYTFRIGKNKK